MIRHRGVALADASSLVFFGGFGALVLGSVLFLTGVWHQSVLRAGFELAPGPLLAGLFAFPGGLLGARLGHRAVGTAGLLLFIAGGAWWVLAVGAVPDYPGAYLPGSAPRRVRRRPDAALARRRRHRAPAARALRHRHRPLRHVPADRPGPRRGLPGGPPRHGHRRGGRAGLPPRLGLHGGCSLVSRLILGGSAPAHEPGCAARFGGRPFVADPEAYALAPGR